MARIKHTFRTSELPHIWAHRQLDYGYASSLSFTNRGVMSYQGTPIAAHIYTEDNRHCVFITSDEVGRSTRWGNAGQSHKWSCFHSIPSTGPSAIPVFLVPCITDDSIWDEATKTRKRINVRYIDGGTVAVNGQQLELSRQIATNDMHEVNVAYFVKRRDEALEIATRGRCKGTRQRALNLAKGHQTDLEKYCAFFRLEVPVFPMDATELSRWEGLCKQWAREHNTGDSHKRRETIREMEQIERIMGWSAYCSIKSLKPDARRVAFEQWLTPERQQWRELLQGLSYDERSEFTDAIKDARIESTHHKADHYLSLNEVIQDEELVRNCLMFAKTSGWNTPEAKAERDARRLEREEEERQARAAREAERQAQIEEERRLRAESLPTRVQAWRNGGRNLFGRDEVPTALLRVESDGNVHTSWGAFFPVEHARLAIIRLRSTIENINEDNGVTIDSINALFSARTIKLGHYQIDRLERIEAGKEYHGHTLQSDDIAIFAGCHVVLYSEVQRLALELSSTTGNTTTNEVSDNG